MSEAFQLHHSLSTNARNQTARAVSLEEHRKPKEALAAYKRAAELLTTYLRSFSRTSPAYIKLTASERAAVAQTHEKLKGHLENVIERCRVLQKPWVARNLQTVTRPLQPITRSLPPAPRSSQPTPRSSQPTTGSLQPPSKLSREDPLVKAIEAEILDNSTQVEWDDIYGLDDAKRALQEMVVLPALRPDLYKGLRAPGRGILLFGPPGTGKTLIAKAVATNVNATFFSISASSLNSKFHGESERLVRTLFAVARERQPSFVFIDEVDSILGARSEGEHEASRRLKTEFMAQFDGAVGSAEDRVYVMAASNRPQDLDDAVRRRLDRRIYVPLPNATGRRDFFRKLTSKDDGVTWSLSNADFDTLSRRTAHFSGSDIKALCREASLMPLRELGERVSQVHASEVRACNIGDFEAAVQIVRPSSNRGQIAELEKWNMEFGSQSNTPRRPGSSGGSSGPMTKAITTAIAHSQTRATSQALVPRGQSAVGRPKRSAPVRGQSLSSFFASRSAKR